MKLAAVMEFTDRPLLSSAFLTRQMHCACCGKVFWTPLIKLSSLSAVVEVNANTSVHMDGRCLNNKTPHHWCSNFFLEFSIIFSNSSKYDLLIEEDQEATSHWHSEKKHKEKRHHHHSGDEDSRKINKHKVSYLYISTFRHVFYFYILTLVIKDRVTMLFMAPHHHSKFDSVGAFKVIVIRIVGTMNICTLSLSGTPRQIECTLIVAIMNEGMWNFKLK